jgi:transcription-repair coupling factor (superfamily II helicase)
LPKEQKNYTWQLEEDSRTLLEAGVLESSLIRFALDWEELCARAADFPVVMADSFTVSSYPLKPREIVSLSAKQLPSYGGSLETAAGDIAHYVGSGYRTVILCQDERRAGILSEYLREKSISAVIDLRLERFPGSGECVVALGALSAGMENPNAKLAVITEGQLVESVSLRKKRKKLPTNRERLQSFADLSPGDLVVHEHYGIGRYVGIFKMPVDGIEKEYVKIPTPGRHLYVPRHSWTSFPNTSEPGGRARQAVKNGRRGLGAAKTRAKSAQKRWQGAYRALCRAAAGQGTRFRAGLRLADGI